MAAVALGIVTLSVVVVPIVVDLVVVNSWSLKVRLNVAIVMITVGVV